MYAVCKSSLQLMFDVERIYRCLRGINAESTELRTLMIFYARMVVHDIHLLSEVKKDIRTSRERLTYVLTMEGTSI